MMTRLIKVEYVQTKENIWNPNFFETIGNYIVDDGKLLQFVQVIDVEAPNIITAPIDRSCLTDLEFQDRCSDYLDKILDKLGTIGTNNNGETNMSDIIRLVAVSQKPEMIKS